MNLQFATLECGEEYVYIPGVEVTEEPPPKPEPQVAPFWWEDYNGRQGHPVNADAAMEAVRAKCRDYRSDPNP